MKSPQSLPYINNMTFPKDTYWEVVKNFIHKSEVAGKILAPCEFCVDASDVEPYAFSYLKSAGEYDCVVLHKGLLSNLSRKFLVDVYGSMTCVFANEVFVVFSRGLSVDAGEAEYYGQHLPSFRECVKKIISGVREVGFKISRSGEGRTNYLLVSANNFGNLGDDAITVASRKLIKKSDPSANVILCHPPFKREDLTNIDYVVLGGGGIFYDACFYNVENYLNYIFVANELGIPSFSLGIGTQGIKSQLGRTLYKKALNLSLFTVVRDKRDHEVLVDEVGVTSPVHLRQDVVFSLADSKKEEPGAFKIVKSEKPVLLYSLLDSSKMLAAKVMQGYQSTASNCVGMLCQQFDVILMVQSRDDMGTYKELVDDYGLKVVEVGIDDVDRVVAIYEQADLVLTSRFHGFIFSLLAGVPVISTGSRGGKIHRLISHSVTSAKSGFIPLRDFSMEALEEKLALYEVDRQNLVPAAKEVDSCKRLSTSIVELIKKEIFSEV